MKRDPAPPPKLVPLEPEIAPRVGSLSLVLLIALTWWIGVGLLIWWWAS